MAERNQKVYERVLQELQKNPELGSRELYGIAQSVDKSVASDTLQQFHARYYLPAKRERRVAQGETLARPGRKPGRRPGRPRKSAAAPAVEESRKSARAKRVEEPVAAGVDRDRVRKLFHQFAQELIDADSRSDLVQVLGRIDNYVEKVAGSARG